MRSTLAVAASSLVAALALAGVGSAASGMKIGFYDEALTLEYPDDFGFRTLDDLGADVVRMNLYWNRVAKSRPANGSDPSDPAYDWRQYDKVLGWAKQHGIEVILSVFGTPGWANGGKSFNYAPSDFEDLEAFAQAAAKRYPQVVRWLAWNEPNAPNFLKPQSALRNGKWVFTSPVAYASICNAVVDGVNAASASNTVACGVLNPNGKLRPTGGKRDAAAPVPFLTLMKGAGARPEVIAHHPYAYSKTISPGQRIKSKQNITLGNLNVLVSAIDRLYGKGMRLWVTEYAYQTNPPDKRFGVSWKTQAKYLTEAFKIMRKHPRIDVALWFQLADQPGIDGWQSGVFTNKIKKKPSYAAFKRL